MVLGTILSNTFPDELIQLIEQFSGFVRGYKSMREALKNKPECFIEHYSLDYRCFYQTELSTPGADAIVHCFSNKRWLDLPEPLDNTTQITWYEFCRRRGQNGCLKTREDDEPPISGGHWVNPV